MYISSVVVVFSSEEESLLLSTSIGVSPVIGCSLSHTIEFISKSPVVKSYLKRKYRIINLTFKYSKP